MKNKMRECQVCGHKTCEHISELLETQTAEVVKLKGILETAARIAGKKLTGKDLDDAHVKRVADMIFREEQMATWMTLDERTAMEMEIGYRDYRIQELEDELKELKKL